MLQFGNSVKMVVLNVLISYSYNTVETLRILKL